MRKDSIVLSLEEPVTDPVAKLVIDTLHIAPIRAKHMRAMQSTGTAGLLEILQAASGESREVIDLLSVRDASRALEVIGEDFGGGPATGAL